MDKPLMGRRFFVEQAFKELGKVNGDGLDWVHLGLAEAALRHVLDNWEDWALLEEIYTKGAFDGQERVGTECSDVDREARVAIGGGGGEDVEGGDATGEQGDEATGTDGKQSGGILYQFSSAIKLMAAAGLGYQFYVGLIEVFLA